MFIPQGSGPLGSGPTGPGSGYSVMPLIFTLGVMKANMLSSLDIFQSLKTEIKKNILR